MPTPVLRDKKSKFYWLRKRVPDRYRAIVGRAEVWESLKTVNRKRAAALCATRCVELEEEWEQRLLARQSGIPDPITQEGPIADLTLKQLHALAGECYREFVAQHGDDPDLGLLQEEETRQHRKPPFGYPGWKQIQYHGIFTEFLKRKNLRLSSKSYARFISVAAKARGLGATTVQRRLSGDFSEPPEAGRFPPPEPEKLDAFVWFDKYAKKVELAPSTVERWRPAIKAFTRFLKHSDLAKVTKENVRDWRDALLAEKVRVGKTIKLRSPRTVRDVYLAAIKAVYAYLVEDFNLPANPAAPVVVRNVETEKEDDEKGFSDKDALTILTATLQPCSPKMSVEMAAARRWVPWICAYTGARVNEITSLNPQHIDEVGGVLCFILRKEVTKLRKKRNVPVHSDLVDQGFLAYVEVRKKLHKPLFYDPARSRGHPGSHSHYQKVGERLAEWIRTLPVDHSVAPNHGWRHRWKSQSRHLPMHPQVADFIQGHGSGSVSAKYGAKWPKTLKMTVEMIPRYRIRLQPKTRRRPSGPRERILDLQRSL